MVEGETRVMDFETSVLKLANSSIIRNELYCVGDIDERRLTLKERLVNSLDLDDNVDGVSERTLDRICHMYQTMSRINLGYPFIDPEDIKEYPIKKDGYCIENNLVYVDGEPRKRFKKARFL